MHDQQQRQGHWPAQRGAQQHAVGQCCRSHAIHLAFCKGRGPAEPGGTCPAACRQRCSTCRCFCCCGRGCRWRACTGVSGWPCLGAPQPAAFAASVAAALPAPASRPSAGPAAGQCQWVSPAGKWTGAWVGPSGASAGRRRHVLASPGARTGGSRPRRPGHGPSLPRAWPREHGHLPCPHAAGPPSAWSRGAAAAAGGQGRGGTRGGGSGRGGAATVTPLPAHLGTGAPSRCLDQHPQHTPGGLAPGQSRGGPGCNGSEERVASRSACARSCASTCTQPARWWPHWVSHACGAAGRRPAQPLPQPWTFAHPPHLRPAWGLLGAGAPQGGRAWVCAAPGAALATLARLL